VLIETYDDDKSGSIIFSKNKFDFLTNFVIVDKLIPDITNIIDYKEISTLLNNSVKKNLILYRLLTNDENLDPFTSKIGFFLKLKEKIEIVYFDPIFILKDLEHLKIRLPKDEFRFKIQQVGYRSKSIVDYSVIYEEYFCIDLSDEEAKNQNDSIFAETMLSLKINSEDSSNKEINKSKQDIFKNIQSEFVEKDVEFYNLEKSESFESKYNPKRETKIAEDIGDQDFFSRVTKNKNKKTEYKSSTLKMFR